MDSLHFMLTHGDALVTLALAGIAVVKLTAWGRANAEALQTVVDAIEQAQQPAVKQTVAQAQGELSEIAQDALLHAVQTADVKKTPLTAALRVCRELLRGLLPVR